MPNKYHLKIERCHKYLKVILKWSLKHTSINICFVKNIPNVEKLHVMLNIGQELVKLFRVCPKQLGFRLHTASYKPNSFPSVENILSACLWFCLDFAFPNSNFISADFTLRVFHNHIHTSSLYISPVKVFTKNCSLH